MPDQLLRRIRAAQSGGAMRGERRTVTMLFADIQGSTAAAERMDPEDWADIINGAFEHLIAPIYRYEGTLARLQGDAILAFFGAPIAHEDDPIRAVRAGLDIVEALEPYSQEVAARTGVPVAVRVGINTGLVVVGEVGSDLRVEYTALGDAINVAARMEQTADPGTVRVTEETADLLRAMFDLADIGGVEVKGKAAPVRAFEVRGLSAADTGRAGEEQLVGRSAEQQSLMSAVTPVLDGVGGICLLVGEAGLGKSRLLAALHAGVRAQTTVAERAEEATPAISWLEGASRSFDTSVPYASFAQLLRRWWTIDDEPGAWDRIAAAVAAAVGAEDLDMAAFLATVVGVEVPPEQAGLIGNLETPILHARTTAAVLDYLTAEAARRPLVLILDDLHWADALSLALVEGVMGLTDVAALSLVLALRPYRNDPSWRLLETAGRDYGHRSTTVTLEPLGEQSTQELLLARLGDLSIDEQVRTHVLERADGNPLFVEELARGLQVRQERGRVAAEVADIPNSLTGLLTARLDQLGDDVRYVAQVASVAGGEFDLAAVAALLGEGADPAAAVAPLVRAGIVVERRRRPEPVYAFRHALIQETAYSTTLLRSRRELHGRLAEHLESSRPEAVQEIARHFREAGERERAFPYLVETGRRAARSMALSDAIDAFSAALDAAPPDADPYIVAQAHDGLGEAYALIPDLPQASSAFQRLRDYGKSCSQPSIEVTALNRLGMAAATHAGDFARAEGFLNEARQIAERSGDEKGLAEYHMNACFVAVMQGELGQAIEHDAATQLIGEQQGSDKIRFNGLMRRAMNLLSTGQFEDGEAALAEAVNVATRLGLAEPKAVLEALGYSELQLARGDFKGTRDRIEQRAPILDRFGSFYAGIAHARLADLALALGDIEGTLAAAISAHRAAVHHGQAFVDGMADAASAHAYAYCGMTSEHDDLRSSALETLPRPMGEFGASTTWRHLAYAALVAGDMKQAAEDFAVGLATSSTTRFWERPALLTGDALAAIATDDLDRARRNLDMARTFVAEHDTAAYAADLDAAEGRLAAAQGRSDEADQLFDRAVAAAAHQGRVLLQRSALAARADLAERHGRTADGLRYAAAAAQLTRDVAATIADERLRAAFEMKSAELVRAPAVET